MSTTSLPEPGDVIADKYVIERQLGRGGMGVVYAVTHRVTGKHLALKCLLPEYLQEPELVERFLREAQAAGRIEHRHIVDVFDAGRDGSVLYIVMTLLEGKPLTALLQDETLTLEEMLGILVRAMDGVAAAHALGIVHRDLKPDNIFVCVGPSGRLDDPRVLDFGISKLDDDADHSLTQSGMLMGTPYYMSFEQMNGQRDLDQRVDVYAIGVILYEALAGQLPYDAETPASLAIRMLQQPARDLSELRPELPVELCEVVMRAMARERDERYPTMTALIEAIRPFAPLGAGSLVVAGQGTPLRNSRQSQLQAFANSPTETPLPKAKELLRTQHSERSALRLEPEHERSLRRMADEPRVLGAILVMGVVVMALGLGAWWFTRPAVPAHDGQFTGQGDEQGGYQRVLAPSAAAPNRDKLTAPVPFEASTPERPTGHKAKPGHARGASSQPGESSPLLEPFQPQDAGVGQAHPRDAGVTKAGPNPSETTTRDTAKRAADAGADKPRLDMPGP